MIVTDKFVSVQLSANLARGRRLAGPGLALVAMLSAGPALAGDLPMVKASDANRVPDCATPGRLMAYASARNASLDPRLASVATHYMRHGEALGLRWDYAFFQMLLETGALAYNGEEGRHAGVKLEQYNFAGLGAVGAADGGESFKDVSTGLRAHLEHVMIYAGLPVADPVAERTRKVLSWDILSKWQKAVKGPISYRLVSQHWAEGDKTYADQLQKTAQRFYDEFCSIPDPRPGEVALARKANVQVAAKAEAEPADADVARPSGKFPSGSSMAQKALAAARAVGDATRSALGAPDVAPSTPAGAGSATSLAPMDASAAPAAAPPQSFKLLNGPLSGLKSETSQPQAATTAQATAAAKLAPTKKPAESTQVAALTSPANPASPAPAASTGSKCHVWTASYGGQKAVVIKAPGPQGFNFTVLSVHEGSEKRETDAYISAYAKGGQSVGEFGTETQALEKAFDLCPEG